LPDAPLRLRQISASDFVLPLAGQIDKLHGDVHSDANFVSYLEADTIFSTRVRPEHFCSFDAE